MPTGKLIVIAGPSGSGKDTVITELMKFFPRTTRLVTTTSRPMRPGNREGIDHYFVSTEEFERRLAAGKFIEHNIYNGFHYGIEKEALLNLLSTFEIVFAPLDVNGKNNLKKLGLCDFSVFLIPESLKVIRQRIEARGGLTEAQITERLTIAERELPHRAEFDLPIINTQGKLAETTQKIAQILLKNYPTITTLDKTAIIG